MDKYIIVIQHSSHETQNVIGWQLHQRQSAKIEEPNIFNIIQHKQIKTFLTFIKICEDAEQTNKVNWKKCDGPISKENFAKAMLSDVGEILMELSDDLPPPGCCQVYIDWHIEPPTSTNIKELSPILGALKKLNLWHHADIKLVDPNLSEDSNLIADFVGGICTSKPFTSRKLNADCIWSGSLDVSLPESKSVNSFSGFSMYKHFSPISFVDTNCRNFDTLSDTNVWIGDVIKVLDLVDMNTVPLLYRSDYLFVLQCEADNSAGLKLQQALEKYQNGGFLCKFDYAISEDPFSSCKELSSENWRNVVLNEEMSLENPKFFMNYDLRLAHFLITLPKKKNELDCKELTFHMHALKLVDELSVKPLIDQSHTNIYNSCKAECLSYDGNRNLPCINAAALSTIHDKFSLILQQVMKSWRSQYGDEISAENLQQIVNCTEDVCDEYLRNFLVTVPEHFTFNLGSDSEGQDNRMPELSALFNKESKLSLPMAAVKATDSVMDALWSNSVASKIKTGTDSSQDVLSKLLDKNECRKILSNLSSFKQSASEPPNLEKLQDFTTALTTSYHGISYNVDARSSEKQDRYCRRTVEKLVKYETFSVGSKSQVPSPATMNINDSPPKQAKVECTPGKKKRLQKVAEKLYKKRAQSSSINTSMVLRSTPTKKNSTNLIKEKLAASPSVHKMELRSSTPTKEPLNARRRILSSASSTSTKRKTSQKTYVQDNKKKLQDLVICTLANNGVMKDHKKFNKCAKRLYDVSMAFLKDLKSSKGLEMTMKRTVEENVKLVLSFEIGGS
uniref:Mdm2-binding protein-like n=1 Tax=Phallusia mammillata TaxID=59560 RepID=A0A6F9DLY2_9ASCI|nr:mdm2-binding protein-like [Phallusia mammillata]